MKFLHRYAVSFLLLQVLSAYGHEGVHLLIRSGKTVLLDSELLENCPPLRVEVIINQRTWIFPRSSWRILCWRDPGLILFSRKGNYFDREMCESASIRVRTKSIQPRDIGEIDLCG